jgi:hypothetical protein
MRYRYSPRIGFAQKAKIRVLSKTQASHSPQPSGWGSAAPTLTGNHFNGFSQSAIPNHSA